MTAQDERAERAREQDQGQEDDEGEHVGEVRVDGVDEVAVLGGDAAECRVGALRARPGPASIVVDWTWFESPSAAGNASTRLSPPLRQAAGAADADDARGRGEASSTIGPVAAAVLDEDDERLHHAGRDARVGEHGAAGDRVAAARHVLHLRLVRVELQPAVDEHADDREPASARSATAGATTRSAPAAPDAVLGVARSRRSAWAAPACC